VLTKLISIALQNNNMLLMSLKPNFEVTLIYEI
jgi:hypothetical protein